MKKKYLLFATQLYCYPILRPLQQAALDAGHEVAWFLHGIDDRLENSDGPRLHSVAQVQQFNPQAVFVPTRWVPDFFPGVKVQVFHGFDAGKRANTRQSHFRIRGLYDLYCTQGPNTTQPHKELAEKHGYFGVAETGWCKLDAMFNHTTPNQLRTEIGTDKPIVMFATTFTPALSSAPALIDTIKRLASTGRWHWIVTLHPKSDPTIIDAYRQLEGENLSFYEPGCEVIPLLHAADVMLCDTSSIVFEFLLLNKPVVTFKTSVPGDHLIDISNTDDVENALTLALKRPAALMQKVADFGQQLHPLRDGQSSQRILKATDDFISNTLPTLKARPVNILRKVKMRKWMGYHRWR